MTEEIEKKVQIPNHLKQKVLNLVYPEYENKAEKTFRIIENTNKEEAFEKTVKGIKKLVQEGILDLKKVQDNLRGNLERFLRIIA